MQYYYSYVPSVTITLVENLVIADCAIPVCVDGVERFTQVEWVLGQGQQVTDERWATTIIGGDNNSCHTWLWYPGRSHVQALQLTNQHRRFAPLANQNCNFIIDRNFTFQVCTHLVRLVEVWPMKVRLRKPRKPPLSSLEMSWIPWLVDWQKQKKYVDSNNFNESFSTTLHQLLLLHLKLTRVIQNTHWK